MTKKVLSIDETFGSVNPALVDSNQQQQWVDVIDQADLDAQFSSESYTPVITSSGAGVVAPVGLWTAHRIEGIDVIVVGALSFTPAVALTPEDLTFSLPTSMQPQANFAAVTALTGAATMQGVHAATNGLAGPAAKVATKTGTLLAVTMTAVTIIGVVFRFKTS